MRACNYTEDAHAGDSQRCITRRLVVSFGQICMVEKCSENLPQASRVRTSSGYAAAVDSAL